MLHALYWLCSEVSSSALLSVCSSDAGSAQLPGVVTSPLVRCSCETLHRRWGCGSAPCLGMGKLDSWASKTPRLKTSFKHVCTLQSSLVMCTSNLVLQVSKATVRDYYLGTAGMNLVWTSMNRSEQAWTRSMCWLLWAPPSLQIPAAEPADYLATSMQIPCNLHGVRSMLGLSFPTSCFSYLLTQSVWSLRCREYFSLLPVF